VKRVLAAVVVLAWGCAVWFGVETASLTPGDNAALADPAATAEVTTQVGDAVKAVFSYDYANLARTERAASQLLVGAAVPQYQAQFASARTRAVTEKLIRTTTVRAAGVRSLRGDEASVLLFLDQQTITQGGGAPSSSVAQLSVTAKRVDGRWKLAELTAL
jgi:Mce-associated membrane protein